MAEISSETSETAVVLGGTGPIGTAIVMEYCHRDIRTFVVSRGHVQPNETLSRLCAAGKIEFLRMDLTVESQAHSLFADERIRKSRYVVYAAGRPPDPDTPLISYALADWRATLDTYVTGLFICIKECLEYSSPGSHFVYLGSAVTRFRKDALPPVYVGHYAAARAAANELCKWASREFSSRGLLLSRVSPAAVDVPFHSSAPPTRRPPALLKISDVAATVVETSLSSAATELDLVPAPASVPPIKVMN